MHSAIKAAHRLRPTGREKVGDVEFRFRMPTMAAIRAFQAKRQERNDEAALAVLMLECVIGENDEPLTEEEAAELAGMAWVADPLIRAILKFANGPAAEPSGDGENPPPQSDAG